MILAVDVHYKEDYAKTVALLFEDWTGREYAEIKEIRTHNAGDYIPGEFYKRELPCILECLKDIDLRSIDCIIIDGYVYVDNQMNIGLGGHLYHALEQQIPVIGIAKTQFAGNKETVVPVYRGESKNPLYVSAIGIDKDEVAQEVGKMYGEYRLPFLLKLMDQKTKEL